MGNKYDQGFAIAEHKAKRVYDDKVVEYVHGLFLEGENSRKGKYSFQNIKINQRC